MKQKNHQDPLAVVLPRNRRFQRRRSSVNTPIEFDEIAIGFCVFQKAAFAKGIATV